MIKDKEQLTVVETELEFLDEEALNSISGGGKVLSACCGGSGGSRLGSGSQITDHSTRPVPPQGPNHSSASSSSNVSNTPWNATSGHGRRPQRSGQSRGRRPNRSARSGGR